MIRFFKILFRQYMEGAKDNYFSFRKYGFFGERVNDPVYNCDLYIDEGCSHVDGMLCDFPKCSMNKDYLEQKKLDNTQCPVCGYYCLGKGGHGCIDKPALTVIK